jgi:NitT/TauT family transport system substrate-binding protein
MMRRLLLAVLLLAAAPAAQAKDLTRITFVLSSLSFNFVPVHIARAAKYFADEGLDVDFVLTGGGPKAMTALLGGAGQFSASVLLDGIMAHRHGLDDVRAMATLSYFYNPMVVRVDVAKARGLSLDLPLKQRVALMKGMRIAITTPGASSDATVRYMALTNGLSPDRDLQIVPLGGIPSEIAGLQEGQVDACACLPGVDILTKRQGLTVDLVRPAEMTDLDGVTYGTLYGLASYNKAHPEVAAALARAIARATLMIADDPDQAKRIARVWYKEMDDPTYDQAWATYLPYQPKQPGISRDAYDKELAFEKIVLPPNVYRPVPYDDVVDTSFVLDAMKGLGR